MNRLISCIDIGKDAQVRFDGGAHLTQAEHGRFLKGEVIVPLFNGTELDGSDLDQVVGVGDKKDVLKRRIDSAIRLNDLDKQQITRIKFSASGLDPRLQGIHAAHDAGTGPEKLFGEHTLVLTPAAVLDPATRARSHTSEVNTLKEENTLNPKILEEFDLNRILPSISSKPVQGGYSFQIGTSLGAFQQLQVDFSKEFGEKVTDYFKGNPTKNKYIAENYRSPAKLDEIKLRVLVKELGDTLQVAWLKDTIQKKGLQPELTAICTNDTVVWLRSILNEVSCVFTEGNVITFYPVARSEAQKLAAQIIIKQKLLNSLERNNKAVDDSFDQCLALLQRGCTFASIPIRSDRKEVLVRVMQSAKVEIGRVVQDIARQAGLVQASDMTEYRVFIESHMLKMPFHVAEKQRDIKHYSAFRTFLPTVKGEPKIRFNPDACYTLVKGLSNVPIERIMGDIPLAGQGQAVATPEAVPMQQQGGAYGSKEQFLRFLTTNTGRPGFLSYIMLNYVPEILLIAYAYLEATGHRGLHEYDHIFNYETGKLVSDCVGTVNLDLEVEMYATDTAAIQRIEDRIVHMTFLTCMLFQKVNKANPSIFDASYPEIHWVIEMIAQNQHYLAALATIQREYGTPTDETQSAVIDLYQTLVDAEVSLTILNKRDTTTPMEYKLREKTASSIRTSTPPRRKTAKRSKSVFRSVVQFKSAKFNIRKYLPNSLVGSRAKLRTVRKSRSRSRSGSGSSSRAGMVEE